MLALRKANVLPGFAGINTFINTNSGIRRPAAIGLTGSYPYFTIMPVNSDIAYTHYIFMIKYRYKALAVICSMPESAGCISYIKFGWISRVYIYIHYPATHYGRANISKL